MSSFYPLLLYSNHPFQCDVRKNSEGVFNLYNSKIQNEHTILLANALLSLDTVEDVSRFLEDILTIQELQSISQRMSVAYMLKQKSTYQDIVQETGASTATISRVNRSLLYGADGYRLVLDRLESNNNKEIGEDV